MAMSASALRRKTTTSTPVIPAARLRVRTRRLGSASNDGPTMTNTSCAIAAPYYDDGPRFARPPRSPQISEFDRKVVIEKDTVRNASPARRPGILRRQSSLDTFDRRPSRLYEREEYGPPARREDFRPPPNVPIPLPRSRALPPPRRYGERDYYEEIRVSGPRLLWRRGVPPLSRAHPREGSHSDPLSGITALSRDLAATAVTAATASSTIRSSSRSSSVSSTSSSSSGGTTVKSEYPKKGKTRIPARLVSKRALQDLSYPYIEEVGSPRRE